VTLYDKNKKKKCPWIFLKIGKEGARIRFLLCMLSIMKRGSTLQLRDSIFLEL
jgi:hypothetical protein